MVLPHLPSVAATFSILAATLIPSAQALFTDVNITDRAVHLPYGTYINHCYISGKVALTFDDGPYMYTEELLGILYQYGAKATFFVNGYNLENNEWLLQRIINEGHQLASHTWSHAELPILGYDQIVDQMTTLESAFADAVGLVPTYMRPPYLAVNDYVLSVMGDLGYHVIGASIDTKDYENDHPDLIGRSVAKFNRELDQGGTIILSHDIHEQTVRTLTHIMLDEIYERGMMPTTVGECLGEDTWYR